MTNFDLTKTLVECSKHVDLARHLHPKFVKKVSYFNDPFSYRCRAEQFKSNLRGMPSLENALLSEVNEFLHEVAIGNHACALQELADVFAVMYRAVAGDIKKNPFIQSIHEEELDD